MTDHKDISIDDDRLLDLLVDGELDQETQRRLLASFDNPGGWRRCALAFLEAQAWGSEFRSLVEDLPDENGAVKATAVNGVSKSAPFFRLSGWLAVAAGLMVAFTLGLFSRGLVSSEGGTALVDGASVEGPSTLGPSNSGSVNVDDDRRPAEARNTMENSIESSQNLDTQDAVTLVTYGPGGEPQRRIRAPLIDEDLIDPRLRYHGESAVPVSVQRTLEELGYETHTKRRYAPLRLRDGSHGVVPVDDVQITPIRYAVF